MTEISKTTDTNVQQSFVNMVNKLDQLIEPVKFRDAVKDEKWVKAMNKELEAFEVNDTWDVTALPSGTRAIGCKWLYKLKYQPDGSLERHKARLVIQGYKQMEGSDYFETFAPVAKMTTVRSLLVVASMENWYTCEMDVTNIFLHGELKEEEYMQLHYGYKHVDDIIQVSKEGVKGYEGPLV
ncbi:hypothetical protein vseg_015010 [Gypsophila vaccaria]